MGGTLRADNSEQERLRRKRLAQFTTLMLRQAFPEHDYGRPIQFRLPNGTIVESEVFESSWAEAGETVRIVRLDQPTALTFALQVLSADESRRHSNGVAGVRDGLAEMQGARGAVMFSAGDPDRCLDLGEVGEWLDKFVFSPGLGGLSGNWQEVRTGTSILALRFGRIGT